MEGKQTHQINIIFSLDLFYRLYSDSPYIWVKKKLNRVGIIGSLVAYVTQHLSPQQSRDLITHAFGISNRNLIDSQNWMWMESFLWFLAALFICTQRNWFYLSHQVSSAEASLIRHGTLCPLLILHDGILSGLNTVSLLHDAPISVSSYEYQSYCSWKTVSLMHWCYAWHLALIIFLSSLQHISLSLEGRDLIKSIYLRHSVSKSPTLCPLPICSTWCYPSSMARSIFCKDWAKHWPIGIAICY